MRVVVKIVFIILISALLIKLYFKKKLSDITIHPHVSSYSGLPLPRFVSLKASRTNIRVGPGSEYRISWTFLKRGLPVEILQEYNNWRYIRDYTGSEGWVYGALLSGIRYAIVMPFAKESGTFLYKAKNKESIIVATVVSGAVGRVMSCDGYWCYLKFKQVEGWILQQDLWGVYKNEKI